MLKKKKINDLIVKKFKNQYFNSLIWDNKICWVGVDIVEYFGYAQKRKAINDCIRIERLQEERDYKTLSGEELKEFKEVFSEVLGDIKFAPKIIIFYRKAPKTTVPCACGCKELKLQLFLLLKY
ncbi:MAG: hypothetical protein ACRCYE_03685 [Sarcina sp.]